MIVLFPTLTAIAQSMFLFFSLFARDFQLLLLNCAIILYVFLASFGCHFLPSNYVPSVLKFVFIFALCTK